MKNNLYNEIVKATAAMASVSKDSIPTSKGCLKRWTNLSDFWTSKPEIFNDVFYKAIVHIATGRYPNGSKNLKQLLALVENAILFEAEALRAWRRNKAFSDAFKCVKCMICRRNRHCSEIRQFTIDRLYCLTFYRDEFRNEIDYSIISYHEIKRAKAMDCVRRRYKDFLTFIHSFIPDSETWSVEQLTSEKHILNVFKTVHGGDYADDLGAFSLLFNMMSDKYKEKPYYKHLFRIKDLEPSMVAVIWPENIEKEISKQLLLASKKKPVIVNGDYCPDIDSVAPSVVNSSWAFGFLQSKLMERKLSRATRKQLLRFAMNIHPWVARENDRAAAALKSA